MKYQIKHNSKGILMLIPCEDHNHSNCWIFEDDIPIKERFNKLPVIFISKKKAIKYINWLVDVSGLEKRDIKILEERIN